jgi:hypothetical protein
MINKLLKNKVMSENKKILNYIVMVCAVVAAICFCIDKNWEAALWAMIAFGWIINTHLTEDSYYFQKKELDELTKVYFNSLNTHEKEVKELKNEIEKLNKN